MSGRALLPCDLVDLETGEVVGRLLPDGRVRSGDPAVVARVAQAFAREVLVRDGQIVEELDVCFADVETLRPGDPRHAGIVLRNLALLAGLLPRAVERTYRLSPGGEPLPL